MLARRTPSGPRTDRDVYGRGLGGPLGLLDGKAVFALFGAGGRRAQSHQVTWQSLELVRAQLCPGATGGLDAK